MRYLVIILILASCNPSKNGIFGSKSPHEKYGDKLSELKNTRMGMKWFTAAENAKFKPLAITLPYRETGYFAPETPSASGYLFSIKRGQKIEVKLSVTPPDGLQFFMDLFEKSSQLKQVASTDSSKTMLELDPDKEGSYVLRIQPELLAGMGYTLTINATASLAFPLGKEDNPRIISVWGVDRDGGARSHEGIDIQAKKRTPVVACADGIVTRVADNNLGGKVVFLRPNGKNINLYYAHLDEQLVISGQRVKEGDVVGLVGNTGNAKGTVPHLHFGIYANGAIDPLPFIDHVTKQPAKVSADTSWLNSFARLTREISPLRTGAAVRLIAATGGDYIAIGEDGISRIIKGTNLSMKPSRTIKASSEIILSDDEGAIKKYIPQGSTIFVHGEKGNMQYIEVDGEKGWIQKSR